MIRLRSIGKSLKSILGLFLAVYTSTVSAEVISPPPFGAGQPIPAKSIRTAKPYQKSFACLAPGNAGAWSVENPAPGFGGAPFQIERKDGVDVLRFSAEGFEPGKSTLRTFLPEGDGGDIWAKNGANYVSFKCRSSKPADLTFHLMERGKSPGTYRASFATAPGGWKSVVLPVQEFGLKNTAKVAGIAFRVASAEPGTEIEICSLSVGTTPFSDESWKTHRFVISLKGNWLFETDPNDTGLAERWFAPEFSDDKWRVLQSGTPWQEQGVDFAGYGWYRQRIYVPKEFAGTGLTITLADFKSDDDAWFNGVHVGGIKGEYQYTNWAVRSYTIPPALIRYGEVNTFALRIWGGSIGFVGKKSGLVNGVYKAEADPYRVMMREPGGPSVLAELFDMSDAQHGKPCELVIPLPADLAKAGEPRIEYKLADAYGNVIKAGNAVYRREGNGVILCLIEADPATAQAMYLSGRIRIALLVSDEAKNPLYLGVREVDRLLFAKRDGRILPPLSETIEETPYGKLKLIDEIDCSLPISEDPHPYLQSGFSQAQSRHTPGSPVKVSVVNILGKKARESEYGWFAYRIGRGKLKPHSTYLLRCEYPEDKPRYAPVEIQVGQNYIDNGWKNGVGSADPYDNWPLSKSWQWFDTIVPLDDETTGMGGAGSASSEAGFWVYFLNKLKPNAYFAMYSGGPAVARIKLYEIDPKQHAPVIRYPKGLPRRTFMVDWERQPDHDPADLVRYACLMGYNALSPVIIKWGATNWSEPLNGYDSTNVDARNYWVRNRYDPAAGVKAGPAVPGKESIHLKYLQATRDTGINYVPRFEYGGSLDLPVEARAVAVDGQLTKPNRFAQWCANLLHPLTWSEVEGLMNHLVKPYAESNPQLTGVLWRIRQDRMPISYGASDVELFAKETNTPLPPGGEGQLAAWAAGEMKTEYDDWWHRKRAQFHIRLAELLRGYRPDLVLYYYNWDADKFSLIEPDLNAWAFLSQVAKPLPDGGRAVYESDRKLRKSFTADDYISVIRSGNFGKASKGVNRADYGLRPDLYAEAGNVALFAPANYLCYADNPRYLNYFQTASGLAVSNVISYDEVGARSINPKYEGNMVTPAGPPFSMALELLAYFHGDARTLSFTTYNYGRGFAAAHRRFAQAFLALPAIGGLAIDQGDGDVKVRTYPGGGETYVGVAYKGYSPKKITVKVPVDKPGTSVINLVTNEAIQAVSTAGMQQFELSSEPMELHALLIK